MRPSCYFRQLRKGPLGGTEKARTRVYIHIYTYIYIYIHTWYICIYLVYVYIHVCVRTLRRASLEIAWPLIRASTAATHDVGSSTLMTDNILTLQQQLTKKMRQSNSTGTNLVLLCDQKGEKIMRRDEGIHKKWKPNSDHRRTTDVAVVFTISRSFHSPTEHLVVVPVRFQDKFCVTDKTAQVSQRRAYSVPGTKKHNTRKEKPTTTSISSECHNAGLMTY